MKRLRILSKSWLSHIATWCLFRFNTEETARRTFEYLVYFHLAILPVMVIIFPLLYALIWLQVRSSIVLVAIFVPIFLLSYRLTVGVYESNKEEIWREGKKRLRNSRGVPIPAVTAMFLPLVLLILIIAVVIGTSVVDP